MIKRYLIIATLILLHFSTFAQNKTTISGRVIDKNTREPLIFVNIGVEGTLTGTASNANGDFTLNVPDNLTEKELYFSAIGYNNFTISISEYLGKDAKVIGLESLSYGIEGVEISTQSMVLYRIIKDAASNIGQLFINKPYSFDALYQNELFVNQNLEKKREVLVYVSDKNGYEHRTTSYTDRNYNFQNISRNFEVKTLADGTTLMDDLLNFDIARSGGNILDTLFLNHYDLELLNSATIDSDSLWIIAYKLATPEIGETDVWKPSFYEGKLYVSKPGRILLKAEAHIKASTVSKHGLSVVATENSQQLNVEMKYTTTYKKTSGKSMVDKIALDKRFEDSDGNVSRNLASLLVLSENINNPREIDKRQYHENLLPDPDFHTTLKAQYVH
ncbi:MAG: carboxypeptidase-like regulatory domain-containing protein [Prolixibacteraceae bacterium]|jgi:hypothetical protein|nr:carboxypeptidase-like regulatory domain-containing protein [Prolixibacteraceae bacterium]